MPIQNIDFILKEIIRFLPLFIPIIIIEYGLMIFALIQVIKNEVVYLPKWGWILIIVLINIIGPIVFLVVGKKKVKEND
ncbi:MAG: PLDc N-terminal domain-containing protein [Actinobacteria bacterium]|nr:PLDc N-terminal domain-containing protein [Actinomycetota bacterium]